MTHTPNKNIETPRIYVACLAAYNNGKLHGAWIDATQEPDAIMKEVQTMLKASPEPEAEEFAIHDYEEFCGISLSGYEGLEQVHTYATFVEEHGRLGTEVYNYYGELQEAIKALTQYYAGCYVCLADFAQELTEDTTTIPENLLYYIDYESMARDMEMSGDIVTIETGHVEVHVFWNH